MRLYNEDIEILEYLVKRSENANKPVSCNRLLNDYLHRAHKKRTPCMYSRVRGIIVTYLATVQNITILQKVKLLFLTSTPVDPGMFEMISKAGEVELDEGKRIVVFKEANGGIHLEGEHRKIHVPKREFRVKKEERKDADDSLDFVDFETGSPLKSKEACQKCGHSSNSSAQLPDASVCQVYNISKNSKTGSHQQAREIKTEPEWSYRVPDVRNEIHNRRDSSSTITLPSVASSLTSPNGSQPSLDNFTSKKDFLNYIRIYTGFLNPPELIGIQNKIDDNIRKIGDQDSKIRIDKLNNALKYALDFLDQK